MKKSFNRFITHRIIHHAFVKIMLGGKIRFGNQKKVNKNGYRLFTYKNQFPFA